MGLQPNWWAIIVNLNVQALRANGDNTRKQIFPPSFGNHSIFFFFMCGTKQKLLQEADIM